ncbi:MAG TPA: NADH-quinone oxidoreductase subunit C, partial [Vicinamibacterales bacterium]|nr:NADH-quinone oxidoreductase subunit C [Vicinamibacterales bacterium]
MPSAFTMPPLAEHLPAGSFETEPSADGMPTIAVPAEHLVAVSRALHDTPALAFSVCVDITAADHFPREPRFDIVYHLVAPENGLRLRVRVHA